MRKQTENYFGKILMTNKPKSASEVLDYLWWLLPEFGIHSHYAIYDRFLENTPVEEIWENYENIRPSEIWRTEDKIIPLEIAIKLSLECRQEMGEIGARSGVAAGKFRTGPHEEHITLLERAKQALGRSGLLLVGVESEQSIKTRERQGKFVLPNEARLTRIAALSAVDHVFLMEPSDQDLRTNETLERYFDRTWAKIRPHIFFFGTADHELRSRFEQSARQSGYLLLWKDESKTISTTQIIRQIQQAID
jgi:glycerol-3-phosphate cytidylyltransferase-like family protein